MPLPTDLREKNDTCTPEVNKKLLGCFLSPITLFRSMQIKNSLIILPFVVPDEEFFVVFFEI